VIFSKKSGAFVLKLSKLGEIKVLITVTEGRDQRNLIWLQKKKPMDFSTGS